MRRFTKYIIQGENVHVSFHDKTFENAFHLFSPQWDAENLRPTSISSTNNHFMVMKLFQQRPEIHLRRANEFFGGFLIEQPKIDANIPFAFWTFLGCW